MHLAASDVVEQLSELPPFPKVTSRLLLVLDDPMVSVDQLADLITSDPSLVLKVIHLANSPFYMVSRPVESVNDAVFVLGISTIKSITTSISIHEGISQFKPHPGTFSMEAFWRHSYGTAILASKIGKKKDRRLGDRLYLAGIVHDIGKLVQACYWPETWRSAVNQIEQTGVSLGEVESHLFGQGHAEITTELCRRWGFPDSVVSLLVPTSPAESSDNESDHGHSILISADRLASAAGFAFPPGERRLEQPDEIEEHDELTNGLEAEIAFHLNVLEN